MEVKPNLFMYIHHFLEGFINSWHANDYKLAGTSLIDHKVLATTLHPKSNKHAVQIRSTEKWLRPFLQRHNLSFLVKRHQFNLTTS